MGTTISTSGFSGFSGFSSSASGVSGYSGYSGSKYNTTTTINSGGNDVSIAGFDLVRVATGGLTFTGFAAPAGGIQTVVTLVNVSTGDLTLVNLSGSSLTANRIVTGTNNDLILGREAAVTLVYNTAVAKWMVMPPHEILINNQSYLTGDSPGGLHNVSMIKLSTNTFEFYEDTQWRMQLNNGTFQIRATTASLSASFIGYNRNTANATLAMSNDGSNGFGGYLTITNATWVSVSSLALNDASNKNFLKLWIQTSGVNIKWLVTIHGGITNGSHLMVSVERWSPGQIPASDTKITIGT